MIKILQVISRKQCGKQYRLINSENIFYGKIANWSNGHIFFAEEYYVKDDNYTAFEKVDNGYRIIGDTTEMIYDVFNASNIKKTIVTNLYQISEVFEEVKEKTMAIDVLKSLDKANDIIQLIESGYVKQIKR